LYRQEGHQGSRVCGDEHVAHQVGREIHYAAWPGPRNRSSTCKHTSLSVRPDFPPPPLIKSTSVALLQEFGTKYLQSSLCTSLKHMGIGVVALLIL
jgi:hypothetical protein